ncbi:MAG: hypothetical protein PHD65_07520 [Gallionella sp.]|nr:hypothetical protein [Gallionella sp.]
MFKKVETTSRRKFLKSTIYAALLASFRAYGVPQVLMPDVSGAKGTPAATDVQYIEALMAQYFAAKLACKYEIGEIAASDIESRFTSDFILAFRKRDQKYWSYQQAHPPVVLEIHQEGDAAKVVTAEPSEVYVYTLQKTHVGWLINQIAWKCSTCDGTGSEEGYKCIDCHGEGWNYGDFACQAGQENLDAQVKVVPENLVASGLLLKDVKNEAAPKIDIRELVDMHSAQFYHSRLSAGQRIDILLAADEGGLAKALDSFQDEISPDAFNQLAQTAAHLFRLRDEPEVRQQALLDSAAQVDIEVKAIEVLMHRHFAKFDQITLGESLGRSTFLSRYFTPIYWKRAETDFLDQRRDYMSFPPDVVLSVDRNGDNATVVTSKALSDKSGIHRGIYHLKRLGAEWRIDKLGWECVLCMGTGLTYEEVCIRCKGEKWTYSGASAR